MKNIIMITIIGIFLSSCTAAQQGAVLGGLGGAAGSAFGKGDRKTTAIIGGVGAATGYMIGNEMDKKKNQSQNNHQYQSAPGSPRTDCRKVVTRRIIDGAVTESMEEVCEGQKSTQTY